AMYVPFTDEQRIDHFVVFFSIMFVIYYLLMKIRKVLYILIAAGFLTLTVTHFSDVYRYSDLFYNYKTFLFNLREGAIRFVFEKYEPEDFAYADDFRAAIDYRNPNVRTFAVNIAVRNFDDLNFRGNLRLNVQCFSIFKEVRG